MVQKVTIIGAGVIGLASAYALVCRGIKVDVIDARNGVGVETSYANGAQLSYRYVAPLADAGIPLKALGWMFHHDSPLKFRPKMDLHQWRWLMEFVGACRSSVNQRNGQKLLELAMHSQSILNEWRMNDGLDDFCWRRNGKLVAFRSKENFEHSSAHLSDPEHQDVLGASEIVQVDPALARTPFVGGIFTPGEEVGDCYLFCKALENKLRSSGLCTFYLSHRVKQVRYAGKNVQAVVLEDGEFPVEQLLVCAGYKSIFLNLPGIRLPIYPLKGYSLTVNIDRKEKAPSVSITDYDQKTVYARLDNRLRIAAMVDITGYTSSIDRRRMESVRSSAKTLFPGLGDYDQAEEWAGMRPATPTGVPVLGGTPFNNLWVNVGHGALGFTLSCGSADLLANVIMGQHTPLDMNKFSL